MVIIKLKTIGSNRCSSIDASIFYGIKQNICIKTSKRMQWLSDLSMRALAIIVKRNTIFCSVDTVEEGMQSSRHLITRKFIGGDRRGGRERIKLHYMPTGIINCATIPIMPLHLDTYIKFCARIITYKKYVAMFNKLRKLYLVIKICNDSRSVYV